MSDNTAPVPGALALLLEALKQSKDSVDDEQDPASVRAEGSEAGGRSTDELLDPTGIALPLSMNLEWALSAVQKFEAWPEGRAALIEHVFSCRNTGLGAALLADPGTAAVLARTPELWERVDTPFASAVFEGAAQLFKSLWERRAAPAPAVISDDALSAVQSGLDVHVGLTLASLDAPGRIALLAALDPARSAPAQTSALTTLVAHPTTHNEWLDHELAAWFAAGTTVPALDVLPGSRADPQTNIATRCVAVGRAANEASRATGQKGAVYTAHWRRSAANWLCNALRPVADDVSKTAWVEDDFLRTAFVAANGVACAENVQLVEALAKLVDTARRRQVVFSGETIGAIANVHETLPEDNPARIRIAKVAAACAEPEAVRAIGKLAGVLDVAERLSILCRALCSTAHKSEWREDPAEWLVKLCTDGSGGRLDHEGISQLRRCAASALNTHCLMDTPAALTLRHIETQWVVHDARNAARKGGTHDVSLVDYEVAGLKGALVALCDTTSAENNPDDGTTLAAYALLCEALVRRHEETAHSKGEGARKALRWLLDTLEPRAESTDNSDKRDALWWRHGGDEPEARLTPGTASCVAGKPLSDVTADWVVDFDASWSEAVEQRWAPARAWAAAHLVTRTAEDSHEYQRGRAMLETIVNAQCGETCVTAIREYGHVGVIDMVAACAETAHAADIAWHIISDAIAGSRENRSHQIAVRIAGRNLGLLSARDG